MRMSVVVVMLAGNGGCFPMHFDSDELLDGRRVGKVCRIAVLKVLHTSNFRSDSYVHACTSWHHSTVLYGQYPDAEMAAVTGAG
jgi:hypothetical protein